MIRLELNLLGIRGARMNDMLAVLKLLGDGRINTRIAARFPLAGVGEAHTRRRLIWSAGSWCCRGRDQCVTIFCISFCLPVRNSRILSITSGMISSSYSTM